MSKKDPEVEDETKIKIRKIKQSLRCDLTANELRQFSDEMARRHADRDSAESEFESVKMQFKDRIQRAESDVSRCARLIRDKYEMRDVDCRETMNWKLGRVNTIRLDTAEVIVDRPMYETERQMQLPEPEEGKRE